MNQSNTDIQVHVRDRILKPVAVVFDAVIDPLKMSNYFISGSSGPMKPGPVTWEFGDLGAKVAINVLEVELNKMIVWESTALAVFGRRASNSSFSLSAAPTVSGWTSCSH